MVNYIVSNAIIPISKKRLIGFDYILFSEYVTQSIMLYTIGVTMGYMYSDKIHILLELMTEDSSKIKDQVFSLREMAKERYRKCNANTKNFTDLYIETELPELMQGLHNSKILKHGTADKFYEVSKTKFPVKSALLSLQYFFYEAIGFGLSYPEITEKYFMPSIKDSDLELARKSGLHVWPELKINESIEDRISNVKLLIEPYVMKKRPDLLDLLGLQKS